MDYAFYILLGCILVWIIFSWIGRYPSSEVMQRLHDAVHNIVNPIMMPIRERLPPLRLGGMALDLSPIIALLGLWIGSRVLGFVIELFIRPVVTF